MEQTVLIVMCVRVVGISSCTGHFSALPRSCHKVFIILSSYKGYKG